MFCAHDILTVTVVTFGKILSEEKDDFCWKKNMWKDKTVRIPIEHTHHVACKQSTNMYLEYSIKPHPHETTTTTAYFVQQNFLSEG